MGSTSECFYQLFVSLSFILSAKSVFLRYHKVKKKGKLKKFVKQFDEMVKTNPEEALDELKKMELARMKVRGELREQTLRETVWKERFRISELLGLKRVFPCFHDRRGCL